MLRVTVILDVGELGANSYGSTTNCRNSSLSLCTSHIQSRTDLAKGFSICGCDQQLCWSVHSSSQFLSWKAEIWHSGQVCVCVCVHVHCNWLKGGAAVVVAYCERVHSFKKDSETCTDLVERFVMSQRTADQLFGPTGKRGRGSGSGL